MNNYYDSNEMSLCSLEKKTSAFIMINEACFYNIL